MATYVNAKDKTGPEPQIRVLVAPSQIAAGVATELEAAGYKKFDSDKVFGRKDWIVKTVVTLGFSGLAAESKFFTLVPALSVDEEGRLRGALSNAAALEYALKAEKAQTLNESVKPT